MSLTTGRGPFSPRPAGRFVGDAYVEPYQRRVRGLVGDRAVVDSTDVVLVHRPGRPPVYAFPAADVSCPSSPSVDGYVEVPWSSADRWLEERDEVFIHPRSPYHRIDILRTDRRLHVSVGATVLVDTDDTLVLHETSLAPKLYVHARHLRVDLVPSPTTTYCPYKGTASYWGTAGTAGTADVAWSYEDPLPESSAIAGYLSFDPARATVVAELPEER